ncbi:MAG: 2-hydroxy-3-keto-5-methylthiopentenyl-1-phosphate phosphatase [Flavobacteriales bacterium]|jgi:2-hydroxy-3-keto-5-methylthiopentenyl-1-phosphate phosphatase
MKISKEIVLKIELSGTEAKNLKNALHDILAAEEAVNQGLGYLKKEEKEILKSLLSEIKMDIQ